MYSKDFVGRVCVLYNKRLKRYIIDFDNYYSPQEDKIEEFDSVSEAKLAFPAAICMITPKRRPLL